MDSQELDETANEFTAKEMLMGFLETVIDICGIMAICLLLFT
jgi:hypothetical protein